ncbi:Leucine-rich repeat receptor-like serine/threonine-protein kinase BAM3 [Raphanus sativus]|uniref:non-specific serine/threonine protein kinase n=1 Tax=Raphanus sativus TaxID=3726 RepID=A0A6J0MHI1_RAPSA|nr:leucine-rich repeat receptor-like serine/threonine-protein kinase BAM3 [Raphanus sativus]KAJ4912736.1 Leucine-rich repeat receptor-like serine/threonine-protein kinase BAM3 [Raphanus sativus]
MADKIFTFFLILSSVSPLLCSSSGSSLNLSLVRQAKVLVSLKQRFASYDPSLDSWNIPNFISLCSWTGVSCDNLNQSITRLDISSLNIYGTLSPEIHKLSSLEVLNISNNAFEGELEPLEFGQMSQLVTLDAYNNNFDGSLPLSLTKLTKLGHLNLGGNYFHGEIPRSYGDFLRLKHLDLSGNDLSGRIPNELGNITTLEKLYLGYDNEFHGIPAGLGSLINLVLLDLANCSLRGSVPTELGKLKNLEVLFLQINALTGSIPRELGNMTSLKALDLSNNFLEGVIPLELSGLQKLQVFNLFLNRLHGEIHEFVSQLPDLEVLKLWHNNFTGKIPKKLGSNGKLVEIDLSTNKLTGLIPETLCFGRKLKILILFNNFLFGSLPKDLGQCEPLWKLRLGQNFLTGKLPKGLVYLPHLWLLELQNNFLAGEIEEQEAGKARSSSNLTQINLSNNRLSGPIPGSIKNLRSLQTLLLGANRFTGQIPGEIGSLKSLCKIDVSGNSLSGKVPPELGECQSLTYLDLSHNQISGQIPVQISQIRILNQLNVSWNLLNQSLPVELGYMKSLTSADFSHNNFSGSVPTLGQFSYFNSTSFLGNPFLCGYSSNPCNGSQNQSQSQLLNHKNANSLGENSAKFKLLLGLGILGFFLVFIVLALVNNRRMRRNSPDLWKLIGFQKLGFRSEHVLECVKENNVIGKGGAGIVYKGLMPNGEEVAVKKLLAISKGSSHDNGLSAEIQTLGSIRHRNIVRLLAFCSNKDVNLLVYEYMPNGSLGEALHGKAGVFLKWETRLQIALEAAKGLCYLHHDCSPLIIHRDVKSNNILLGPEFEAHVADFGLAKFMMQDIEASQCMSSIAGSYGYIAPEYGYTLRIDEKSDVYSFGVVLLELITGRKPLDKFGEEGVDIVQWSKIQTNCNRQGVIKIIDQRLSNVPMREAMELFFVAMLCVQEHSVERPTMREVVQMISQAKQPNTI